LIPFQLNFVNILNQIKTKNKSHNEGKRNFYGSFWGNFIILNQIEKEVNRTMTKKKKFALTKTKNMIPMRYRDGKDQLH